MKNRSILTFIILKNKYANILYFMHFSYNIRVTKGSDIVKFLFKLLVLPALSILAVPAIFLASTYKSVEVPEDFSGTATSFDMTAMITEELDAFLLNNNSASTLGVAFSQQDANLMIKGAFVGMNPLYLDETATGPDQEYVMSDTVMGVTYGYQGSWVTFTEDIVEIESGIHLKYSSFTFKTRILITLRLEVTTEAVSLKLEQLTIGNLPVAWIFGTVSWAAEQFTGNDIETLVNEQLQGIATFDPVEREILLDVPKLIETQMANDPQSAALVNSLLAFINENQLLDIGFEEEEFAASLNLGKTRKLDEDEIFVLAEADKIIDEADMQTILASKANAIILSTLTATETDPYPFIELDAFTLNRIFEFMMRDQLASSGVIHEIVLFEKYNMKALVPYVTMTDVFTVNIPLIIEDITAPENNFQTIIKINATPSIEGADLKITLNSLSAGEVNLSQEHITNILTFIGNNDLIVDGAIVIQDFDSQMSQTGMSIESVMMINNNLRLYVSIESIDLGEIQDAVNTVLDIISENDYSPELNEAIDDVLTALVDPEADPEVAVEALIEELGNLTDEEQEALLEDMTAALEDSGYTLEEILGLLP